MPTPDNEDIANAPSIVPERDELVSYQRQKQSKPRAKEREDSASESKPARASSVPLFLVGLVAVSAVAAAGYLYTQLQHAQDRVAALEQRLSSTDESVNQSSGALQVKINELNAALTQLSDETLKKYKTQIDQQGAQIATLDKTAKNVQASIGGIDKKFAEQKQDIENTRADLAKLPPLIDQANQRIDQQQASVAALSGKVKSVNDAQTKLDMRLSNNEEWVDSINVFRKQMNREIVNIKQQIAGSKPQAADSKFGAAPVE